MGTRCRLWIVVASTVAANLSCGMVLAGEQRPVPAVTIYPGDVIHENMLTDGTFPDGAGAASYATNRTMLLGKVARRTLLPGQSIPANAVAEPKLVAIGARVRLVFEEGGLVVSTYASALQAGGAGDFISVRNMESGVVISGTVASDGSVHIGAS